MGATLRLIRATDDPITVWPLFAELVRRHDISREECIIYGVIVALARTGQPVTFNGIRDTMAQAPLRRNRVEFTRSDRRDLQRRVANLVAAGLVVRRHHPPRSATHYIPTGPQ